ncbi:T-cell surface glycoprotein CD8 alpha chain [Notolabrus celidotus]|uniref:T-cell surface glycoprotein CD8 alpha chain n=1 Tax=Notolabrus celidotus TaxID=1203425 RepID=UPI0014906960|nr:T-cell surface glycoprotein CD8 alpha chain [Notolabrus celidotus]
MGKKWIQILMILVFCHEMTPGACEVKTLKENVPVEIRCEINNPGSTVVWFRALDTQVMEYLASFNINGDLKSSSNTFNSKFSLKKGTNPVLTLTSFRKAQDSGVYSCASQKSLLLKFGQVTRLVGEVEVSTKAPLAATNSIPRTTPTPCVCDSKTEPDETSPLMICSPFVLGPLVGGCGLLLLLLIITALYCNHIRTRRCPHHYRRKPRPVPPGKQMMTNRRM